MRSKFRRTGYSRPWFQKVRKVVTNMAEAKFVDVRFANPVQIGAGSSSLSFSLTNGILQGTTSDASTRVGNRIFIKGIWVSLKIIPSQASLGMVDAKRPQFCRVMIVKNTEGAAGLVNIFELFTANGSSATQASWCSAFRNSLFYKKYQVLADRVHQMSPGASVGSEVMNGPGGIATFYIPIQKQFNFRASTPTGGMFQYNSADVFAASWHEVNNVLGDDYQCLMTADNNDSSCCSITMSWKVLFNDF